MTQMTQMTPMTQMAQTFTSHISLFASGCVFRSLLEQAEGNRVKQILVNEPGGPEQMAIVEVPTPTPPPGHALVAIHVAGVNFLDVYFRTGLYKSDRRI